MKITLDQYREAVIKRASTDEKVLCLYAENYPVLYNNCLDKNIDFLDMAIEEDFNDGYDYIMFPDIQDNIIKEETRKKIVYNALLEFKFGMDTLCMFDENMTIGQLETELKNLLREFRI